MNTRNARVLVSVLAGVLGLAATAPVAMRVEVEPVRQAGDETEVAVIVQVSPEDRARIGTNAIMRIELDGGAVSSGSPMRAVSLGDDGTVRLTVQWPPGEHDLRVQIEDSRREDTGLWVGKVRIPDLSSGSKVQTAEERKPVTEPAPEKPLATGPEAEAAAAGLAQEPAVETTPIPEPSSEPETPAVAQVEDVPPDVSAEATEGPPVEAAPVAMGAAAVPEVSTEDKKPVVSGAEPELQPEETGAMEEPAPAPVDERAEPEEELPVVEPLRAEPPPGAPLPDAVAARETEPPERVAVPVSAETAARFGEWERADPDTRDVSVTIMRGREPVRDIDEGALRLRIGGSDVPIEKLGDAGSAPLLLGFALDVRPGVVDGWSGARASLAPLVERASGGRGRVFVATSYGVGEWGAEPVPPEQGGGGSSGDNVARLVAASLTPFADQRGRSFLVILTDGRNEPTKAEWTEANDAAAAAGVPILVVALWDEEFSNRTRKNLKRLTVLSGGSLFLVQGTSQLDSAMDRFGGLLDGSYALRFDSPSESTGKAIPVSVTADDRDLDVSAPESIR